MGLFCFYGLVVFFMGWPRVYELATISCMFLSWLCVYELSTCLCVGHVYWVGHVFMIRTCVYENSPCVYGLAMFFWVG